MKIEAFIPDWPGYHALHAASHANVLARRYPTRILDDPADYFNAQWQKARDQFTGDILLWVMADVTLPERFNVMLNEMERVMGRGDIGWYAPDVTWTSFIFNKAELKQVENEIYEVPNTDSLLFAVRGDVVRKMPFIDPKLCFMWGMDVTAATVIRQMGLKMVRDYRFKAQHPNSTGYNIDKASGEMGKLFAHYESIDPRFAGEVRQSIDDMNRLKRLA